MSRPLTLLRCLSILALIASPAFAKPPAVTLTTIVRHAEGLTLNWQASSPELQFTVESRTTLGTGTWEPVPDNPWPTPTLSFTDARPESAAHYYRVAFAPIPGQRGRLISATKVSTLNKALIQFIFQQAEFPIPADKEVNFYKIIYETVDAQGLRTTASGALALPVGVTTPLPLISYQHGSILEREDVPSRLNLEGLIGVAFATSGYAAVLPDYLGLGDSPGFHPYHHADSEATCVVDLLRAARTYCSANGVALNEKLFLTGYSQGGHATLAALRAIESSHAAEFSVTACAAGAGAYDLSETTLNRFLQGIPVPNPYYYPYLIGAFVDVYGFTNSLGDLLRQPWRLIIPPLFNGITGSDLINAALPANALDAFEPNLIATLQSDPEHPLRHALADNDLLDWTPLTRLRLYHCSGDQDVTPLNSKIAYDRFRARGATQVELIDPAAGADHTGCVSPTLLGGKAWFDSLR